MSESTCFTCGKSKPLSEFNGNKTRTNGVQAYCRECEIPRQREYYKNNKQRLKELAITRFSTVEGHCRHAAGAIKQRGKVVDVDCEYLVELYNTQKGCCAVTGKVLDIVKGSGQQYRGMSLDRINNDEGYIKGNVRWVCNIVNTMKNTLTDEELEEWCVSVVQGLRSQKTNYVPNLNTIADVIDRMVIDIHKLAYWENLKRQEQAKENPDIELIARADNLSRDCCEIRSVLKTELNKVLSEVVNSKAYYPIKEVRTFTPAALTVAEILADVSFESAMKTFKPEFIKAMQALLDY